MTKPLEYRLPGGPNKQILWLLHASNAYGTGRGFSDITISQMTGLGITKTRLQLTRLRNRGMLYERDGLWHLKKEKTYLGKKDGLPYEKSS